MLLMEKVLAARVCDSKTSVTGWKSIWFPEEGSQKIFSRRLCILGRQIK